MPATVGTLIPGCNAFAFWFWYDKYVTGDMKFSVQWNASLPFADEINNVRLWYPVYVVLSYMSKLFEKLSFATTAPLTSNVARAEPAAVTLRTKGVIMGELIFVGAVTYRLYGA